MSLAVRASRSALGLRRRSADLLHALGKPRVSRDQRRVATEAVTFALVLTFGAPAGVIALELTCGLVSQALASVVHLLGIWVGGFASALQLLRLFEPSSTATIVIPIA